MSEPPARSQPMIAVQQLSKTFDRADGAVLDRISFELAAGETLSIIGPSGCGKTTLLYILAGLLPASGGQVSIRGKGHGRGDTAFILQNFGLFPWKTVYENVVLGMKIRRQPPALCRRIVQDLLDELGLAELARRYPTQLSGGQQQRVAIARALATRPDLLLMDEPFSSLDALTREHLQNTVLGMWRKKRLTYIIVTHSVAEAVILGRRVVVFSDRPTRIKTVVDNPDFGRDGLRDQDCYFHRIRQLRRAMERRV